jgi:cystathionine beta-synthase
LKDEHNALWIDQYNNKHNPDTHYKTTGPEIWDQMGGKIDYLFLGVGTGGSVTGMARYLKEKDPNIKVIGNK